MKKKYSKKQIYQAIAYWENKLNEIDYAYDYDNFYCKANKQIPFNSMNIKAPSYLNESIQKSICKLSNSICVFNPYSYMNLLRCNESYKRYLDEKERKTEDTSKLIDAMSSYCKNNIRKWKYGVDNFNSIFDVSCYDPNAAKTIYGNVVLNNFPFDVTNTPIEKHIELLSRRALLLGYNYVTHDIIKNIIDDGIDHCYASLQFEATYFSSNVKMGDILYHISPKSLSDKILKRGLLPSNKNSYGFNYGSRVYMFIDKYDEIFQNYAAVSNKISKKFITNKKLKDEILDFYEEIQNKSKGVLFNTHEFSIFKIDTNKLNDVKLYRDNTFDIDGNFIAVYATQPIKPDAISLICNFIA